MPFGVIDRLLLRPARPPADAGDVDPAARIRLLTPETDAGQPARTYRFTDEAQVIAGRDIQAVTKIRLLEMLIGQSLCAIEGAAGKSGTGLLVAPDLVLTNHHVIADLRGDGKEVQNCRCRFDFLVSDAGPAAAPAVKIGLAADWLVLFSPEPDSNGDPVENLDYALIRLEAPIGSQTISRRVAGNNEATRGWITLEMAPPLFRNNDLIHVWQHPEEPGAMGARQLPQSRSEGIVTLDRSGLRLLHNSTTRIGSSGGPCFNSARILAGLHRAGEERVANVAVPMGSIVDDMNARWQEAKPPGCAAVIGLRAPASAQLPWLTAQAQTERAEAGMRMDRVLAANILIDRSDVEAGYVQWRGQKAVLHVLVCRSCDSYKNFLTRLLKLTLRDARTAAAKRAALREGRQAVSLWDTRTRTWPRAERPVAAAFEELKTIVADLGIKTEAKNFLLDFQVMIDSADLQRDRQLAQMLAQHCAAEYGGGRLQIVLVYFDLTDITGAADVWAAQRAGAANFWPPQVPLPGCGYCVAMGPVEFSDLNQWCSDLNEIWSADSVAASDAVQESWTSPGNGAGGLTRLPMKRVEALLKPIIEKFVPLTD